LFTGGDDSEIVDRRNGLRKQIEDRLIAAAASGKDLEGSLIVNFYNTDWHQMNLECWCSSRAWFLLCETLLI